MELTQEYLKSVLHYDPDTGVFTWLVDRGPNKTKGRRAGRVNSSRPNKPNNRFRRIISFTVGGKCRNFKEHRLAFLYMTGAVPVLIDHKNTDSLDNRWDNLRPATGSQNSANAKRRKDSISGIKGVGLYKNRTTGLTYWRARVKHSGRERSSYHVYRSDAEAAYRRMSEDIFGEFARSDSGTPYTASYSTETSMLLNGVFHV